MSEHGHETPATPGADAHGAAHRGHETTDADARAILIFTGALTVTLIVIVGITGILFYAFNPSDEQSKTEMDNNAPLVALRPPPPTPPLQPSKGHETLPYQDLGEMNAINNRLASTISATPEMMADKREHTRIRVVDAMQILADTQGMMREKATDIPAPQGSGTSIPTPYSNGGRGSVTGSAAAPGMPADLMTQPTTQP